MHASTDVLLVNQQDIRTGCATNPGWAPDAHCCALGDEVAAAAAAVAATNFYATGASLYSDAAAAAGDIGEPLSLYPRCCSAFAASIRIASSAAYIAGW